MKEVEKAYVEMTSGYKDFIRDVVNLLIPVLRALALLTLYLNQEKRNSRLKTLVTMMILDRV